MRIEKALSILEAFEKAVAILNDWSTKDYNAYCWFRGVKSNKRELIPGAYRKEDYDEWEVLMEFVQVGAAFTEVGPIDTWDTYCLAQHHGISTRLLDWTESFSAALFFALDGWDGKTTPCVWILQPGKLNRLTMRYDGVVAPENWPKMSSLWLPRHICKSRHKVIYDNDWIYNDNLMIAIYPRKANRRIIAQQGTFTVHGRYKQSISEFIQKKAEDSNQIIARIDLNGIDSKNALQHLALLGIRRHAIYPDIDNFVKYLHESY
jgi:hypothetical protein